MAAKASYLTNSGCDLVVATSQASINSGLLELLNEETQPKQYVCFVKKSRKDPVEQISLEDLMVQTEGVNPFYIPDQTPEDDVRMSKLKGAHFKAGVMLQMGIPEGHTRQSLPPIVTLKTADSVTFNLYCKQARVVSMEFDEDGAFLSVCEQPKGPSGELWTMTMSVDLTTAGLDDKLNTDYFNKNPKLKSQLLKRLYNLSGTAFSLQQLLFDLDNGLLEKTPNFSNVTNKQAKFYLEEYFRDIYVKAANEQGLSLVAVTKVSHDPDPSSLDMTGFERTVTKVDANNGEASTLNYLCAINNHSVPSPNTTFGWNWVSPGDINQESGVIAINRNILAQHIAEKLKPACAESCYLPIVSGDYTMELRGGQAPTVTFPPEGTKVIQFKYATDTWIPGTVQGMALDGSTEMVRIITSPEYDCDVYFNGNRIIVDQKLWIVVVYNPDERGVGSGLAPVKRGVTDTYEISADQTGALHLTRTDEKKWDESAYLEPDESMSRDAAIELYLNQKFRDQIYDLASGRLHEFQISQIENFVFPGARTFTYKEPTFSDHQDLVCKITYLDPHEVSPAQNPKEPQGTQEGEDDQTSAEDPPPPSPLPIRTSTVGKLTASTALMQNYIQGEIVSPSGKFEALQTSDGHALLFGIDSAGVFHVIEEQSGTSHTGWQIRDLSTAAIQVQFPGETRAVVRTFDVGQSVVDGSIGLMMAVQLDGNDHLFFSLGNSNEDLSWISSSHWTMVPFDPVNEVPQKIAVRGAMFADTEECEQYLVVDIDRPSQNAADPHIARYHIDSSCTSGHYWVKHDVTIDLAASSYQSAVGRMRGKPVDGIYNAGTSGTGGAGQLIYEPVINAYGNGPATPVRFKLPGGAIPSAIATAHSAEQDGSTDLYSVGGSTLYCFPADWEEGVSEPLALCTSDFLAGTDTLRAMTRGGITTLWGRNQSNQVYYLSSPTGQVFTPAAWSAPVPILAEIEHMSAYVNCADGGNTIFTAGNGRFERIIQGSAATGRVWRAHEIAIAAPPQQKCISIRSYTTTIHVSQSNGKSPIPKATVQLSSTSRAPVYINGLYYMLNPVTPVLVSADATGTLTVVETTDSLQAAVLTVSLANITLTVNPMDNTMAKIKDLGSAEKLRSAQVPTQIIAGGIMDSPGLTSLVDPSTNDEDVEAVAQSLCLLKDAYDQIRDPNKTPSVTETSMSRDPQPQVLVRSSASHLARAKATNFGFVDDFWHTLGTAWGNFKDWLGSVGDAIATHFGDIWQGLKHEGEALGRLFCDAASGLWHFVVRIGGKVFHAALDTWHSFIGAANWLIGKVVDFTKNAWAWFQSLVNWPDIRRTKQVAHNVIRLWMQHQVDQIPELASRWDHTITEFRNTVNQFAGITDFSPLDDNDNVLKKPATEGAANPNEGQTPDSLLLANKYRDHAHELTILGDKGATTDGVEDLLNDLLTAISQEGAVLEAVFDQLQKLITEFSTLSIEEILKRLMGIVADTVLSSVQVVVDALLKVLRTVVQSLVNVLDTKIHIPVISDLLNLVGVPDLSFLDLFAWIIGMAYTVVYKITHNKQPPFPAHDNTVSAMISANSWGELTVLFGQPSGPESFSSSVVASFAAHPSQLATSSSAPETYWFRHGHTLAALVGIPLAGKAMADAEGETMPTQAALAGFVLKVTGTGLQASANLFSPRDPIANKIVTYSSYGLVVIRVGLLAYFSGAFKSGTEWIGGKVGIPKIGKLQINNAKAIGAIVDAVLALPSIAVTGWHIGELIQKPAGKVRSAAILEECGNVVSYISRASTAIALSDPEPDSKEIAVALAGATTIIEAGFQFAEAEWC